MSREELIKEARKKGYVSGIKFIDHTGAKRVAGAGIYADGYYDKGNNMFHYYQDTDQLSVVCGDNLGCSNPTIYRAGVWAKIVANEELYEIFN